VLRISSAMSANDGSFLLKKGAPGVIRRFLRDAVLGMFLGTILPREHLSPDARDVIKVATISLWGADPRHANCLAQKFA
jgi:hypothetical protein